MNKPLTYVFVTRSRGVYGVTEYSRPIKALSIEEAEIILSDKKYQLFSITK